MCVCVCVCVCLGHDLRINKHMTQRTAEKLKKDISHINN